MKKILAFVLLACMMLTLCACGSTETTQTEAPAEATEEVVEEPAAETTEEAAEEPAVETAAYTLGMGIVVGTDSTKDSNAQVDATVATVVLDAQGAIVACRLDCAQNKMDCTAVDFAKTFQSKMELGDNYNMVTYGGAIAEWYDQAKAFEAYVVGMTADQVAAIETVVNEEGHSVAVDETLLAGCTMSIADFMEAVVKACGDAQGMSFETADTFTLGVACISSAAESAEATADAAGSVNMYTEFAAAVVDANGVILATINDAIQPKIAYTADGIVGDITFNGTKRELGDNYNMVTYGGAIAEWFEQSMAFSQYCVGKTAAEVSAIETVANEEGNNVAVDETLLAGCTMSVSGMMAVVAAAVGYAR